MRAKIYLSHAELQSKMDSWEAPVITVLDATFTGAELTEGVVRENPQVYYIRFGTALQVYEVSRDALIRVTLENQKGRVRSFLFFC